MTAQLVVTPNPTVTSAVVSVAGTGFLNYKTRLLLDGVGATSNVFRPDHGGTFEVGITVGSTAKTQTLVAQQYVSGTWKTVASTSIVVQAGQATVPGVPQSLAGTAGSGQVSLTWAAPASTGGSAITGYRVYRNGTPIASPTATNYVSTGLVNGTAYQFAVSAVNSVGEGNATAPITVTPVAAPSGVIYGPGIAIDSAQNHQVGSSNQGIVSYRFQASSTSAITAVLAEYRIGIASGYSGGNNGTIRVSVKADSGGSPTGADLAFVDFTIGAVADNDHYIRQVNFGSPYTVTSGTVYHIVFTNVSGSPTTNYLSINSDFTFDALTPRQPAFPDSGLAVLYSTSGGAFSLQSRETPTLDIVYANGSHDGNGYVDPYRTGVSLITGTTKMVREHFTVSGGDRTVTQVFVRPGRTSGSDVLSIRLETGAGVEIETVTIPAASVTVVSSPGADASTGNWVGASFGSSHVLSNGQTYNLRLSCAGTSQYSMSPILQRDFTDDGTHYLQSRQFSDGQAQFTTNSGSTWTPMYQYQPINTQLYFTTA